MKAQRWTTSEDGELVFQMMLGKDDRQIGRVLKRSAASVDHRARRLGVRVKGGKIGSPSQQRLARTVGRKNVFDDELIPGASMWAQVSAACDLHLADLSKHHPNRSWPALSIPHERDTAFTSAAYVRSGVGSSAAMCAELGE